MTVIISFFVKYLLAPLIAVVGVIVLSSLAKGKALINMKKLILFILIMAVLLALPGILGGFKYEFVWLGLDISIITYLILGACFNLFTKTKAFQAIGFEDFRWIMMLALFISTCLACWGYYWIFFSISRLDYSFWSIFLVLWFFIPLFYVFSRDMFLKIPKPFYKLWMVEKDVKDDEYWNNVDAFRMMQVTVKIKRTQKTGDYSSFNVRLPQDVTLGRWFNRFIEDQNIRFPAKAIEIESESHQYGWIFYTSRWFSIPIFTKMLDFEEDVAKNKIRNKSTIYVRRVLKNKEVENG